MRLPSALLTLAWHTVLKQNNELVCSLSHLSHLSPSIHNCCIFLGSGTSDTSFIQHSLSLSWARNPFQLAPLLLVHISLSSWAVNPGGRSMVPGFYNCVRQPWQHLLEQALKEDVLNEGRKEAHLPQFRSTEAARESQEAELQVGEGLCQGLPI